MPSIRRRRVQASLLHKESDRIPLTMGSPSSSLHKNAHASLLHYLNIPSEHPPKITDSILQIVETDPRILDYFEIDLYWLLPNEAPMKWTADNKEYVDEFGRKFIEGGGFFNQINHPLLKNDLAELDNYTFPDLNNYRRFDHLKTQAEEIYTKGCGLGIDGPWGIYEISSSLVGVEDYLMNMVTNPTYVRKVAEKVLELHHIPFYQHLLSDISSYVQIIGISDDVGAQNGLIFSRRVFQNIFKPLYKDLINFIRSITDAKIYMHSDGSIYPIIPDLIEIGVDGINPVQYTAKDMELTKLKKEFGKDLGFFGGVVDNNLLSFGTPQEIQKTVEINVGVLKNEGGFIFAPIHNISQEVPPENIIALYQAGLKYGIY